MASSLSLSLALLAGAVVTYLSYSLHYRRLRQYAYLPQLKPSLLWGNLKTLGDLLMKGDPRRHADYVFREMNEAIDSPEIMVVDLWPANSTLGIVSSHAVAEQVSKPSKLAPYSVLKSTSSVSDDDDYEFLVGRHSLLRAEGEEWKSMRKRFNPGFSLQNILSMLPAILGKTDIFLLRLKEHAESTQTFAMAEFATSLTFDIIGAVVMDADFGAQRPQREQGPFIKKYKALLETFENEDENRLSNWLNPFLKGRRKALSEDVGVFLKDLIRQKWSAYKSGETKTKTVLARSFEGIEELDEGMLDSILDQIKTFLFAGHDTTSILLQWAFYELSRSPGVVEKLRAEIDEVFGSDASDEAIKARFVEQGDQIMSKLAYTSAIIKEILRLYPPAGSARRALPGTGFKIKTANGNEAVIDGLVIYLCHFLIQRDVAVYGDTKDDFIPERWLGNTDTFMRTNDVEAAADSPGRKSGRSIPPSAWRPFERGPRNCIGQELANIEARIIIVRAVRQFDFVKVGLGALALDADGKPVLNDKGQYKVQSEVYNTRKVTSHPVDDTIMKVRFRSS